MLLPEESNHSVASNPLYHYELQAHHRIYFFERFRLFHDSTLVEGPDWRRTKVKNVLKWLILNKGKPFSADQLIDLFWPDMQPDAAMKNLHVTIHHLRRLVEPDLKEPQKSRNVRRDAHNFYRFELDENWWIDICAVQHFWKRAVDLEHQGDLAGSILYYNTILHYCKQGFLPEDIYDDSFKPFRQQYDHLTQQVLKHLIQIHFQNGSTDDVLKYSYDTLSLNPYSEAAVHAIATVFYQQGNVLEAINILEDFQQIVKRDLGMKMGKELQDLRRKIKHA